MCYEETLQKLKPGAYYHIYNRGNNKEILFKEYCNYPYFLELWRKHTDPVADTICYNLLPNHFHFFVRVKTEEEIEKSRKEKELKKIKRKSNLENETRKPPTLEQCFSNCFNAYTKAINKRYNRTGSLFQERFKRKEITDETYFTNVIAYILTNAVKHGICTNSADYPHSSFDYLKNQFDIKNSRNKIIKYFESKEKLCEFISIYEYQLRASKFMLVEAV